VNGDDYEALAEPHETLRDVLRERLGFLGVKKGCDYGGCGACTVIVNEKAVYSCMTWVAKSEGKRIVTIEGLSKSGKLDPVQEAFLNLNAAQCGYCTPGVIMSARALLDGNPSPSEDDVRDALTGNICRCTGYSKYVEAILSLAKKASR